MKSITSANATLLFAIESVFPIPVQLQGFAADDVFSTDAMQAAEAVMGVDGVLSAGFVFEPVKQGISFQADSDSDEVFDQWYLAQQVARDIFRASAVFLLPGLKKKWTMTRGVLTTYPPMPDAGKTLKPRKFGVTWERAVPSLA